MLHPWVHYAESAHVPRNISAQLDQLAEGGQLDAFERNGWWRRECCTLCTGFVLWKIT
jgi:hypothetical protein